MACPTKGDCYAAVWARRVVKNGGARPSQNTIDAAGVFYNALVTAGILAKFHTLNFFAPDNLVACCTPFIVGVGLDPWTNNNFIASDLTVNGLMAPGVSGRYLDTGVLPSEFAAFDVGFTIYNSSPSSGSEAEMASYSGGFGTGYALNCDQSNSSYWDAPYQGGTGRLGVSNSGWVGYLSGNRTANNNQKLYKANVANAHAQIGTNSNVVNDGRAGLWSIPVFVAQLNDGSRSLWSYKRLSFAAIHTGLTQAESLALYNAIFAFRDTLGGGTGIPSIRDDIESYTDGDNVNGLDGGNDWNGAYVARANYLDIIGQDNIESYTDGAAIAGLNGGSGWNGAYAD